MYINVDDPPKLTDLSKTNRLNVIYNEVVNHIAKLKASGRIPEGMDLNAEGITSQIILESGWGGSSLTKRTNNFGGLTAGKAWTGPIETVENDPMTGKTYNYRVFKTPLEGIQAQVEFYLPDVNPRYAKAGVLTAKTADEHFARVKAAGYAEAPNYVSDLSSFVRSTIRPRLKRGGDEEELANWYSSQESYNQNEELTKGLQADAVKELNKINELEIQQMDNADQAFLEYQSRAENQPTPKAVTKNNTLQEVPELDENTLSILNLTESNGQMINPDIANIQGAQTQIFSEETEKQNAQIAAQQMKKENQLQEIMNASIMEDNNPSFGQGMLFGVDRRAGGYINRFNNGGVMYPRYFNPGGPLDGIDPKNPIKFNVDGETGNLKIYDPNTNSFNVTNVPYKGDTTGMMSHIGEQFMGTDNTSKEAVYGQLKMAQDFYNMENKRAELAQKQIAERTDALVGQKNEEWLPSNVVNFLKTGNNGGQFAGCMAGSSGCLEPTREQASDENYVNQTTIPYFVESKEDRTTNQILPFKNNTAPDGFRETYKNTDFRPNIFPTARVINPNFGKVNEVTGKTDNRTHITKKSSRGNTRGTSTQEAGAELPTITGSATYMGQFPKLGMSAVDVGEPIIAGDRWMIGGRNADNTIKRSAANNEQHNKGVGTLKEENIIYNGTFDENGNWIEDKNDIVGKDLIYNTGEIGGSLSWAKNFDKGEVDSTSNADGSQSLVTRYGGDSPYYNYFKQGVYNNYGFDEASASNFIKNYEQSNVPVAKLPVIKPGLLENKSSGNIIKGEGYPNTRKGRKQKERSDAYMKWYMSQMRKK